MFAVRSHDEIDTQWPVNLGGGVERRFSLTLTDRVRQILTYPDKRLETSNQSHYISPEVSQFNGTYYKTWAGFGPICSMIRRSVLEEPTGETDCCTFFLFQYNK